MIDFTITTEIARPPAEVFAFATDPTQLPRWQTNTVSAIPEEPGPLRVDADLHFEPAGAGTRLRFRVHGQPRGPMRFLQPLLRLALKRQFRWHCEELKRVLEEEAQPTA